MAILPVSGVNVASRQTTFTSKRKDNDNRYVENPNQRDSSNSLAKVPVIVMLAMAPMANGKQQIQAMPLDTKQLTEILAQVPANPLEITELEAPQRKQDNPPLGVKYFKGCNIVDVKNITANGISANLVFRAFTAGGEQIKSVYLVDKNYKNKESLTEAPPVVNSLIYHDLGAGKEFCGLGLEHVVKKVNGDYTTVRYEVRLDDESAQYVIDFLAGEKEYKNTFIKFVEVKNKQLLYDEDLIFD